MLSTPKSGWTDVSISGIEIGPASYIDDVPVMCLQEMICAISQLRDFCVVFDAEGWEFKVIADDFATYVVVCADTVSLQAFSTTKRELAEELLYDIGDHLDDWKLWPCLDPECKETIDGYKEALAALVKDLKTVMTMDRIKEGLRKAVPRYSHERELFTCRNCVHRDEDNHWCKVWKHGISEEDRCSYGEAKGESDGCRSFMKMNEKGWASSYE